MMSPGVLYECTEISGLLLSVDYIYIYAAEVPLKVESPSRSWIDVYSDSKDLLIYSDSNISK